ncbi:MAG: hypothetical protein IJE26_07110, partial [Oscillospiraceae bacterium]|nr:hypothetical protein [Oscillospiraceae bacterium]
MIPLEKLEAYGESTARSLSLSGSIRSRELLRGLRRDLVLLRRAHGRLGRTGQEGGAGQWLLDNWYLAEREAVTAESAFAAVSRLRRSGESALITAAAAALLSASRGQVDAGRCRAFIRGFERKTVFTRRELALFPAALRYAAIRALADLYREPAPAETAAAALFGSLRLWGHMDFGQLLEDASRTEQILRSDPAGVYPRMDEGSRESYRQRVEELARRRGIPEYRVAQRAIRMSSSAGAQQERHVGYWLFRRPLGEAPTVRKGGGYVAANLLLTLAIALFAGFSLHSAALPFLLLLPLSEIVKTLLDTLLRRLTPPRRLPRMELEEGVGAEGRTICVLSVLLNGEKAVDEAVKHLEEYRLANRDCGRELLFGLLADLPAADSAECGDDRALLRYAARAVEKLDRRYGGFYLLTRERTWQPDSGRYTGWERKRGAVMELVRLLSGEESRLLCA